MSALCPGCGSECRARARFCDQCGAALTRAVAPDAPAEVRQGTLLFCDLVQSTSLANALDPDDLRLLFAGVHRVVREVSRRHGGYIIRFVGDGAFVAFGYPSAEEDSAEAAVRAGLDYVNTIQNAAQTLPRIELRMRVGIASGRVVVGEVIDGAAIEEQSVTGPVAHLASRLTAAAAPGGVVLCDQTRRLVGRRFDLEPMGALRLAGFPQPVLAWSANAESATPSRFDALRGSPASNQLIGREDLYRDLLDRWSKALAGNTQAVELVGEAGVGKSKLARALQLGVRADTGAVTHLDLQCTPSARNTPLYPVSVLLRRLANIAPTDDDAAASAKLRALLASFLDAAVIDGALNLLRPMVWQEQAPAAPRADSPELERERLIDSLVKWLEGLTAEHPVLLIAEDLHWSDATTTTLLRRIVARLSTSRLMLVATRREQQDADGSGAGLDAEVIPVPPLSTEDSEQLIRRLIASESLSSETVRTIASQAEGNPLFIEEITRSMLDHGGHAPAAVPTTLQNIIQARLDRVPDLRPAVYAAAVLGREFALTQLGKLLADEGRPDVTSQVARLVEEGILAATQGAAQGSLRFRHALIHDAVYQTILRGERRRLHRRVAELLEADRQSGDVPLSLIAHHWAEAGRVERAVEYLIESSRLTAMRAAYHESIGEARLGLELAGQELRAATAQRLRRTLLSQIGHARTAIEGYAAPGVEEVFAEALAMSDGATSPVDLYPVIRGLGTYYLVRGQILRADGLAQRGVALATESGRSDLLIDALAFAAYPAFYRGRLAESEEAIDRCLALYDLAHGERFTYPNVQEPRTAALALLTTTAWMRLDIRRSEQAAEQLLAHIDKLGRPFDQVFGKVWLAATRILQRRYAAAAELAAAGLDLAQRHGYATWIPAAMMQLHIAQGAIAPTPESTQTLQYVHRAFLDAGAEVSATYYLRGIAIGLEAIGQPDAARAVAQDALERALGGEETYMAGELHVLLARLEADRSQARGHLERAIEHGLEGGARVVALRAAALLTLAEAGSAQGAPAPSDQAAHALSDRGAHALSAPAAHAQRILRMLDGVEPMAADDDAIARAVEQLAQDHPSRVVERALHGLLHRAAADVPVAGG